MSVQPLPRWDDAATAGMSEAQLLLYRSNLLGSDLRITNYGGGNTSAKIRQPDPLTGEEVEVLWVKGSGGDIGSMKMDGFATLYLDKLHALKRRYRGLAHEDEMVAFFPHCTFNLNPRATSIDTPPHCFTPYRHIDHMHADALIAFAAAKNGEALITKAFGDEIGWIPWMRPGFELGLRCEALCQANPSMKGLIFGSHGLVNWGDTSKECYQRTISIIERAAAWLDANGKPEPFGPQVVAPLPEAERRAFVAELAPLVRGMLSATTPKVMHYADGPAILEFVGSARGAELAAKGTTCPDHFLRTKILPLWVPFTPGQETAAQLAEKLGPLVERYATDYAAYYERCKRPDSPAMRDPMPVLLLVPASACSPSRRTSRRRASPPSTSSTRSTSCAGPRASTSTCRSPSRRPSTSSTGCSKRPSCSACRRPRRSKARSRSSPAAPAASARRWRGGCSPRARTSC